MLTGRPRRSLLPLALVAALVVACGHDTDPESPDTHQPAVLGTPALTAVINHSSPANDAFGGFRCAGVLVAPDVVATAFHCLRGAQPGSIDVIVGAKNLCRDSVVPGQRLHVHSVTRPHGSEEQADLALLKLEGRANAQPAEVAQLHPDSELVAYGWGRYNSRFSCTPEEAKLLANSGPACTAAARLLSPAVRHLYACALPTTGRNTCVGDSGGPVYSRGPDGELGLTAITTSGTGCDPDAAGFYLRLEPFLQLIGAGGA